MLIARVIGLLLLIALMISPLLANTAAGGQIDRRVKVGIKLFPAVLSADRDLKRKVNAAGHLNILVVFERSRVTAQEIRNSLATIGHIKSMDIHVTAVHVDDLGARLTEPVAGIFIADPNASTLPYINGEAVAHKIVAFSPYEGDVERGVLSGISVSDRILPYINRKTMDESRVRLKSFFLKIADSYE